MSSELWDHCVPIGEKVSVLLFILPGPSPPTHKILHCFMAMIWPSWRDTGMEKGIQNNKYMNGQWSKDVLWHRKSDKRKPTLENQLHTASLLCLYPRRRCSQRPSQTPESSREKSTHQYVWLHTLSQIIQTTKTTGWILGYLRATWLVSYYHMLVVQQLYWPMSTVGREVSYLFLCTHAVLMRRSTCSDP